MHEIGFLLRAVTETFLPFGIFVYLFRKRGGRIKPYLTGILTLMALVIPRKVLSAVIIPAEGEWAFRIAVSVLVGAFCEESGRYLAMKYFLTDYDRMTDAFCYGLGHGGMEMLALSQYPWEFFLAGLGLLSESPERLQMISEIRFFDSLEAVLDDFTSIALHIACSVLIYVSVRYEKKNYFWLSLLMHSLINILSLYFGITGSVLGTAGICYLTYQIYFQEESV